MGLINFFISSTGGPVSALEKPILIFQIGQSNAAGILTSEGGDTAPNTQLVGTEYEGTIDNCYAWESHYFRQLNATDVNNNQFPFNFYIGSTLYNSKRDAYAFEMGMCKTLSSNRLVFLVKFALGATRLEASGNPNWSVGNEASLSDLFMQDALEAITWMDNEFGPDGYVKSAVNWFQGESDANFSFAFHGYRYAPDEETLYYAIVDTLGFWPKFNSIKVLESSTFLQYINYEKQKNADYLHGYNLVESNSYPTDGNLHILGAGQITLGSDLAAIISAEEEISQTDPNLGVETELYWRDDPYSDEVLADTYSNGVTISTNNLLADGTEADTFSVGLRKITNGSDGYFYFQLPTSISSKGYYGAGLNNAIGTGNISSLGFGLAVNPTIGNGQAVESGSLVGSSFAISDSEEFRVNIVSGAITLERKETGVWTVKHTFTGTQSEDLSPKFCGHTGYSSGAEILNTAIQSDGRLLLTNYS